ncbi:ribosomal protein L53 [Branchiostoma belcheri]|nr:ribosomal protein L53 [Branchiostoma belcheri]
MATSAERFARIVYRNWPSNVFNPLTRVINKQMWRWTQGVTLKPTAKILVEFDPWLGPEKTISCRNALRMFANPKTRKTNPKCEITTKIKNDRTEPIIDVEYMDGERIIFKSAHLHELEIFERYMKKAAEKDPEIKLRQ